MKVFCLWPIVIDAKAGTLRRAHTAINGTGIEDVVAMSAWMYKACVETEAERAANEVRAKYLSV
jgi:hypothetical protein